MMSVVVGGGGCRGLKVIDVAAAESLTTRWRFLIFTLFGFCSELLSSFSTKFSQDLSDQKPASHEKLRVQEL